MEQKKLPADSSAMTLAIISLVLIFIGCCCVISTPIALILSIIGLVSANKSLREYQNNAENYYPQSRTNVYTAKVLNLIALIISILVSLATALYLLVYGTLIFSEILNEHTKYEYYHYKNNDDNYNDYDYYYDDSEDELRIHMELDMNIR